MRAKIVILMTLFLSAGGLFAEQDRIAPGGGERPTSNYSSEYAFTAQPWQQCLRELCGEELNRFDQELKEYMKIHETRHLREFTPLIQAAVVAGNEEVLEEKIMLENLVQAVRQDREISTPRALQFHEIGLSVEHFGKLVLSADGSVDVAATRESMKGMPEEVIARTLKGAVAAREIYQKAPAVAKESLVVLRQRLTEPQIRKQIAETVASIDKNEIAIAKHFGLPRDSVFPGVNRWDEFKKGLTADQLDSYDFEQINERFYAPALLAALVTAFPISDSRKPVKVRSIVSKDLLKAAEERLNVLTEYLAGRSPKDEVVRKALKAHSLSCFRGAAIVDKYFPSAKEIEEFKPTERNWRDEYLDKLSGHLSVETMREVAPFFKSLKIDWPTTRENWMSDVTRDLERIKAEARGEWIQKSDESKQLGVDLFLIISRSGDTLDEIAKDTKELCLEKGDAISDESDFGDRVEIGALSMKEPKQGRIIAFHEYSHSLSGFILRGRKISEHSKGKFDEWRSCLTQAKGGSKKFLEEDFADLMAYNLGGRRMDLFCQRLNDEYADQFTVIQGDRDYEHSSKLFRLLHGALINGEIPQVCTQALATKGEKFEMVNCMATK